MVLSTYANQNLQRECKYPCLIQDALPKFFNAPEGFLIIVTYLKVQIQGRFMTFR